ncbi:hypothetical protein AD998_17535 [bacterium 336/3]|nr:hypothetical protein AD998_17535 [bacterium 336/3]
MQDVSNLPKIPVQKTLLVLIGFPIVSTFISLLLLDRTVFTDLGLDFFNTFWIAITIWYLIQIMIVYQIINQKGWKLQDIGFLWSQKQIMYFLLGYFILTGILIGGIEYILSNAIIDKEKLSKLSSLIPKTTTSRIIFVCMGLIAGITEEIVYRGFAIKVLESYKISKWIAVIIATIPFIFQHGLKSINQFAWFMVWGIILGMLFLWRKNLTINIVIHWLIILSAVLGILQVIK